MLDSLQILLSALESEGLRYQVAVSVENTDIELPMFTGRGIDDVRLTDSDVILALKDVSVSRPLGFNYTDRFCIETGALKMPRDFDLAQSEGIGVRYRIVDRQLKAFVDVLRGYTAVDATVSGKTYRFVNTHLAAFSSEIRFLQTQQLVARLAEETLPVVLVGDFNTAPNGKVYELLQSAGYVDLWQPDSLGTGNTASGFTKRIDYIFLRTHSPPVKILTQTVGDKPQDRLPSGLYPSNHAGVVAKIVCQ